MDITPVTTRLSVIANAVHDLKALRQATFDEFSEDSILHAAAERHFQVAIQAALDIGAILLAEESVKVPENYRDIFPKLAKIGILPQDFAHKIAGMAQFRNVLVHLYLAVDLHKVYYYMQHDLGDLERFAQFVAQYLSKKDSL